MYAGNGAFIQSANELTGFDGISGDLDLVVFFDQECDANGCNNATCWDASVSCVDNGAASEQAMFMETVNNAGQNAGVTIQLNDGNGNGVQLANITSSGGTVSATDSI